MSSIPASVRAQAECLPPGVRLADQEQARLLPLGYQPNFGGRFSRKAAMPSWASGVVAAAAMACVVYS